MGRYWLKLTSAYIIGLVTNQLLMFNPSKIAKYTQQYSYHDDNHLNDDNNDNSKNNDDYDGSIKVIALLGERNSGTKWMNEELKRCFNESLTIKRGLTRYKHWFQYDDGQQHDKTLVIALFRNPYDWIKAMQKKPHHAPNHVSLNWDTFARRPWTMPRRGEDLTIDPYDTKNINCQEGFQYHEVNSCHRYPESNASKWNTTWSQHHPVYELRRDGSGRPYDNLLHLRRDKILNFLNASTYPYVSKLIPMRYEYAVERGTTYLIRSIERLTGAKAQCRRGAKPQKKDRGERWLSRVAAEWVTEGVDWEVEGLIGYGKSKVVEGKMWKRGKRGKRFKVDG